MRRISIYAYPDCGCRIADDITIEDGLTVDEIDKKVIDAIIWGISNMDGMYRRKRKRTRRITDGCMDSI